jgi:hypothetical protein
LKKYSKFEFVLVAGALVGAFATLTTPVGCGPQQRFCPEASDGICRPPPEETGGTSGAGGSGGSGVGGSAIFLDGGS